MSNKLERRIIPAENLHLEVREAESEPKSLQGYAAVFNARTMIETWFDTFTESIKKGAFARAIAEKQNVRSLFNHDANQVLGTTRAGTLVLREDDLGLWSETTPSLNTSVGSDVMEWVRRGEVSGMSFAFIIQKQEWSRGKKGEPDHREITDVDLYDVGPVTYPAYEQTSIGARSMKLTGEIHQEVRSRWGKEDPEEPVIIQTPRGIHPEVILVRASALRRKFAA